MELETWVALTAAVVGPVATAVVAVVSAKINSQNLEEQRNADDTRAKDQRTHDLAIYQNNRRASIADEQAERLREDASSLMVLLDEAWRALDQMQSGFWVSHMIHMDGLEGEENQRKAERKKGAIRDGLKPWREGQIEHRLATTTARLSLFGGAVAEAADTARNDILQHHAAIRGWGSDTRNTDPLSNPAVVAAQREASIKEFVGAVRKAEAAILAQPEGGQLPD